MITFTFTFDPMTGRFIYAGSPGVTLAKAHTMIQDALMESLQTKSESGQQVVRQAQKPIPATVPTQDGGKEAK